MNTETNSSANFTPADEPSETKDSTLSVTYVAEHVPGSDVARKLDALNQVDAERERLADQEAAALDEVENMAGQLEKQLESLRNVLRERGRLPASSRMASTPSRAPFEPLSTPATNERPTTARETSSSRKAKPKVARRVTLQVKPPRKGTAAALVIDMATKKPVSRAELNAAGAKRGHEKGAINSALQNYLKKGRIRKTGKGRDARFRVAA